MKAEDQTRSVTLKQTAVRRRFLAVAAAVGLGACWGTAAAEAWPGKSVRVVVAFAPGGPVDIAARLVAQRLQETLGRAFVVDNKPGAGGNIAAKLVRQEKADGYTLFATSSALAVNQTLYKDPGFDALRDFTPVALIAVSPNILVAHPSDPATDLRDFLSRNKGKSVSFGSAGAGSTPHLTGDQVLRVLGGLDVVHVPFQGAAPALQATMGNQVPIASVALPPAVPQIKAGRVKGLAVTSPKRIAALPDVPTVAESGFPGFEDYTWVALFGPANLPADIVEKLNAQVGEALRSNDMRDRLAAAGLEAQPGSPADMAAYLQREVVKWGKIVKDTGVTQ